MKNNDLMQLPQADPGLVSVLVMAHQTREAFAAWRKELPNDLFLRSRWNDIDDLNDLLIDVECGIASLVSNKMLDNLE